MLNSNVSNSHLGKWPGARDMIIFGSHVGPQFPNIGYLDVYDSISRGVYGYMSVSICINNMIPKFAHTRLQKHPSTVPTQTHFSSAHSHEGSKPQDPPKTQPDTPKTLQHNSPRAHMCILFGETTESILSTSLNGQDSVAIIQLTTHALYVSTRGPKCAALCARHLQLQHSKYERSLSQVFEM